MTQPNRPLPPNVIEALKRGNKIEAIKLLREATRAGLAEAKSAVDHHEASAGVVHKPQAGRVPTPNATASIHRRGGLSPGEVPRSSSGPAAIAILVAIAGLLAWLYKSG